MTPPATYEALASIVNFTLLGPELTNSQVIDRLETAKRLGVGVATVRPCDADLAARVLGGSAVRPGAVAGYPYGFQSTGVKLYEVRDLMRRGVKEVSVVLGLSRLLSREFQHVQTELNQLTESCRGEGARLTVLLDVARLTTELKIIAYTCCERAEIESAGPLGTFTPDDLALMKKHLPDETVIQAPAATIEEALSLLAAGVGCIESDSPATILDAWKSRLQPPARS
jgi:deoxyribose-phosphate aldolase